MARKIVYSFLGIVFLLFAFFQWNDPDSVNWILYYVMVGGMCFASAFGKNKKLYLFLMLGISVVWFLKLLPGAIEWMNDGMPSIVESMEAGSSYIELVREFLGLLISIVVLVILLVSERKRA